MATIFLTPGLEHLVEQLPAVAEAVESSAEQVAVEARAIAPVRSGAYRDSIRVEADAEGASVVADVPYAIYVEVGTSDTPTFAPLRRALEAVGE